MLKGGKTLEILEMFINFFLERPPQQDTANAKVKVSSVEIPAVTNVHPLMPDVGQNIATYALPTAGISSMS